ncbi:tetratricopeptide repeat protein [Paroceanicella profunda]|uniref:Tetratricopeptide repeat protein 38 n=1 Tax=Paroceanicella profunda TaxID=2579971 RepID=A0A5B8FZB8_9RHOB|nr:tetratricopeptide repeat protein [Paroceanicella profunda]QDL93034.1 tetratricopeptide repeat protein [Paroceanicella profunda]
MQTDLNGLDTPLSDAAALTAWNRVQLGALSHAASTGPALEELLAASPGFALGHAVKGLFLVSLCRSELTLAATRAAAAARAALETEAHPRAAAFLDALDYCLSGHHAAGALTLESWLFTCPRDALAMKLAQGLRFLTGNPRAMLCAAETLLPQWEDHPARGYLLGCHAFALEEAGAYEQAEASGRAALDLAPDDAWGLHAVAHVLDMTGRAAEGVRWLAGRSAQWRHCNNFGYHVWWHLALFHIDRGATGPALDLYDRQVRPEHTDDFRDIANAASLLLRLEFEGVSVGPRWEELARLAAARVDDGALVFADLHYQLALVRAGRVAEAEALAARLAREASRPGHDQHEVAGLSGVPLARGLLQFREGAYGAAARSLVQGLAGAQALGGSHAQRDLFQRLAIEAALRAGATDTALALLARRTAGRGASDGYAARVRDRVQAHSRTLAAGGLAAE